MLSSFLSESLSKKNNLVGLVLIIIFVGVTLFLVVQPAYAHHPMGGATPANFSQGFLSGLAHPVIGLDHFVFVVAIGLLASFQNRLGIVIPITFVLATLIGTVIHLMSLDLPVPELIIAFSVLTAGLLLARKNKTNLALLISFGAIAGVFHGYAYGEAIVGAETTPLNAYLFGFILIQLLISAIAFYLGGLTLKPVKEPSSLTLRFAGFLICGVGIAFFSTALLG
ncbi:MAG: HupE/UreJ family protein [Xenococcaceae cyanobacterium MO_188.B32]|nr:HupE/UreJ family protein [Xenococcaceae cyanobacterium MO_188.B32]